MKYCKNCNKAIDKNEISERNLCWNCYREYLLEKIENAKKNKENPQPSKSILEKLFSFLAKIKSRFF